MSETIKTSGEKSAKNTGASHLEVLTEMSDKFDPEKARSLTKQDEPQRAEKPDDKASTERKASRLEVMPEKIEKELSPKDAANEYLALLDELSQDFSNPSYSEKREESYYAGGITRELGRKYSDNPHYRWSGFAGTEAGATDGTMLRIASADVILANEIGWRTEGEKVGKKMEQVDKDIADLDADYSKKGRLGKFFGKRKYEKTIEGLKQSKQAMEDQFNSRYNKKIADELAISYNERGGYSFIGSKKYVESQNEARNRRFFGLDDPERAKKVERAIELRQKYESEWNKKK